jgi:hypothetical protein
MTSGPRCSVCLSVHRAEVDKRLIAGEPAQRIADDLGFSQASVSRHDNKHVRPSVKAVARAMAPVVLTPSPVDILPSMHSMLAKLGETVQRAEVLVADAEAAGGIAGRAVSINTLKGALVDCAKLLAVLGPPPEAAQPPADHAAIRAVLDTISEDSRDVFAGVLE